MRRGFKTCALALTLVLALGFTRLELAQASSATAAKPSSAWVEIFPRENNTEEDAAAIARVLLKKDIETYAGNDSDFFLAARFFNAPGLPKNSFIIASFNGEAFCGTMGCMTYFLKKSDEKKNTWKIVHENNFNSIVTSEELKARVPAFYTKGTGFAKYHRYNAASAMYETERP